MNTLVVPLEREMAKRERLPLSEIVVKGLPA